MEEITSGDVPLILPSQVLSYAQNGIKGVGAKRKLHLEDVATDSFPPVKDQEGIDEKEPVQGSGGKGIEQPPSLSKRGKVVASHFFPPALSDASPPTSAVVLCHYTRLVQDDNGQWVKMRVAYNVGERFTDKERARGSLSSEEKRRVYEVFNGPHSR